jgi:hypothetical protein
MRILRHETGHAIQHAYQLQRRRTWQQLFGRSSTRYPTHYRPNPASKRFVQHLRLWYAQSHPDEDFAETFAVWLRPKADWRKRYAGWPALRKLEYVDELMTEISGALPVVRSRRQHEPLRTLGKTLAEHYEAKRELYAVEFPDTYDRELRQLFSDQPLNVERTSSLESQRTFRAVKVRKQLLWVEDGSQVEHKTVVVDPADDRRICVTKLRRDSNRAQVVV